MIKSITISHFRCFHETKISDFGRVNLIGGQNNAGKTTLLEALYLANKPDPRSIIFLKQKLRSESADLEHPENAWSSLFYNLDYDQEIKLLIDTPGASFGGRFTCKNNIKKKQRQETIPDNIEEDVVRIVDDTVMNEQIIKSTLTSTYIDPRNTTDLISMKVDANLGSKNFGIFGTMPHPKFYPHFVPAGFKSNPRSLAKNYEELRYKGKEEVVLAGLNLIDPNIKQISVFNFGEERIYLQRIDEPFMPLSLFGDALNKVVDIILRIACNPGAILLIDEIENGIHYTHHESIWKFIFNIARRFDVQVFAASHSLEMIRAFNQASISDNSDTENNAIYFEIFRSIRSGEIIGKRFEPGLLSYAIANNQSFRGE